ncbi:unnamed protein product [Ectocarpus sp. 12 AP-2014]
MRLRASTVLKQGVLLLVATSSTCGLLAGSTSRRILCHEAGSRSRRSTSVVMKLARPRAGDRRGIACTARAEQQIQNGSNVLRDSRGEAAAAPSGVPSMAATKAVLAGGPPGVRRRRVGKPGTGERGALTPGKGDVTWHLDARSGAWTAEEMAGAGGSAMQSLRQSVAGLPRLNREDEATLCKDVQRWQRLEEFREEVSAEEASATGGGPGTRVGLEAWAAAAGVDVADLLGLVERGKAARERLVLSHIRLVMYLAGKRKGRTALSSMDLIQEGAIALHLAAERFDPQRGVRFFTYADWSLRAAFERAEASQATTIAIPRYVYVQKRRLKAILGQHCGPQTSQDLATSLDMSERQLAKLLRRAKDCQSMNKALVSSGVTLGEMIPGAQSCEDILRRLDAEASLVGLLGTLKPQEEEVIVHRYGLFGRRRKSTPAVAAAMGVSRQYVGRVHRSALEKMRASFEADQQPWFHAKTMGTNAGSAAGGTASTAVASSHHR